MSDTDEDCRGVSKMPRRVCPLILENDTVLGWTLRIGTLDQDCRTALQEVAGKLGPHGRRYLAKRLRPETQQTAETLSALGLTRRSPQASR
jgi:hypothetical protein